MENLKEKLNSLIEKFKGLDKKVQIGIGAGAAAVVILIIALVIMLGGNDKPAGGNTQGGTQAGTEMGEEVFTPEGDGSKENPFIMAGTTFEAKVPAEGVVYYQMYKVDGMVLTIADENAYVLYGDEEYKAENGVVSVPLMTPDTYTPAEFAIGNSAKEEKTFNVELVFPQGTQGNPIVLELGEFDAKVEAGNDQGVYYTYTATEAGTLTVTLLSATEGIQYDFNLYNLNTYAMRAMSTEGTEDANGNKTVSIEVNAGDVVQITVGTLPNENNEYPAGEFKLSAAVTAGEGNTEDTESTQSSESTGNNNNVGNNTTENKKVEYFVTVKDESGKAISGALVTVGDSFATTDSKGKVSFTLTSGSYTATASCDGYATASKAFGSSTSVTITLKKGSVATNPNAKTYTVEVVDYAGNPIKDTAVSFVSGGKTVATVMVGSNGKATASLDPNNYVVEIKFPKGKEYGYDHSTASLTTSSFTTKVVAAPKADTTDVSDVYQGTYKMQNVYTGGTYLEMKSDTHNYFVFKPKKGGKYRIYTTDANAKVANAGTTGYFTEGPAYSGNSCEFDIYPDQVRAGMQMVISVTGTSECIVVVERIGNAGALTTYKDYAAKHNPSAFTLSGIDGKTQKFVDVAGSFKAVLGADGYYHKDSATGPIIYVVLNSNAKYVSMKDLTDNGPLRNPSKGEDYTNCMIQYVNCVDATYGVYPLTEDLKYMFQQGGKAKGWWDRSVEGGYYLFDGDVNKDIAWMFECCYWE